MPNETQSPPPPPKLSANLPSTPPRITPAPSTPLAASPAAITQVELPDPGVHAAIRLLPREGGMRELELSEPQVRLGKAPENEVVLTDAAVSSYHAVIQFDGKKHLLIDIGSRNGTLLNDVRLEPNVPRLMRTGDVVKLGHSSFTFFAQAGAPATPPPSLPPAQPKTEILSPESLGVVPPPPPAAPPTPQAPLLPSEETLARALVNQKLLAAGDLERAQKANPGKRLYRTLLETKLSTELGLRDLMCRTFHFEPIDLRAAELDVPTAQQLKPSFLREKLIVPVLGGPILGGTAGSQLLAVADVTDQGALEAVKSLLGKPAMIRLATASEIAHKLDGYFVPRLVGVLPSGEKLEIPINQPEIALGKAPHNKVVLNDATVSGTHAALLARDGGYSIVDLGSSNGTFVNSERLTTEARTLQHGDKIQLGKVLLTFRNLAETVENKTARLSLAALDEIRQRANAGQFVSAATGVAAAAGVASAAGMPTPPTPVPTLTPEEEEERAEKKRKKKEKEQEKNKLTSAGNLSRIIAQVLGAMVALIGPILMFQFGYLGGGDKNGGGGGGGGGSVAPANAVVRLTPVGTWTKFNAGIFGKSIEASGGIQVPGANGLLLVDDGRANELVWFPLDDAGQQAGDLKPVPLNYSFSDAEGITYGNNYVYVVTAQSDLNNPITHSLLRFNFDPKTQTMINPQAEVVTNLRQFLLQQVPEISATGARPGTQDGLNIEGIAYDPNNERLLLGLRSPLVGNQAVLVPLRLINPQMPLSANNLRVDSPSIIGLTLGGQGVRDITYDARSRMFLIISGSLETQKKTDFGLWEWSGSPNEPPKRLMLLDEKFKPEGIASVNLNGQNFIMIVGDEGRYIRYDYAK